MDAQKRELRVALARHSAPVAFEVQWNERREVSQYRLANISRHGMFIESPEDVDLKQGSSLNFALRFDRDDEAVTGVAKVRWIRRESVGPYSPKGLGVEVIEFHDHAERKYLDFLEGCLTTLKVADLMDAAPVIVEELESTGSVVEKLRQSGSSSAIVASRDGLPVGTLSGEDLLRAVTEKDFLTTAVKKWMDSSIQLVTAEQELEFVYGVMSQGSQKHLPVVEDGLVVGLLSTSDLIGYWSETMELQARRLMRSFDKAIGVIAHDLRTPIGIIQTTSQMLTSGEMTPVEFASAGLPQMVESNCETMLRLIDDILDVGKIRAGAVRIERSVVDLEDLLERIVKNFAPNGRAKQISVGLRFEVGLPRIKADPVRLEQVFNNLLSNALKFTPEGGRVMVGAKAEHSRVAIWVKDTGIGIAEGELKNLFCDYGTTSSKPTNGEKSTGLGLAICKRLIEAHGGEVRVESQMNQGTTFTVSLPIGDLQ